MSKLDGINPDLPVSSKKLIIGMRNRVIHGYDKIDDGIVWGAVVRHLPVLKQEIENIMKSYNYLLQVAIYSLYNLSKVYAHMNIISLIKNPVWVTA
jgi:hypothetical protein